MEVEGFYVDLGLRLRGLRVRRRLTQQQLGLLLTPPVTRASIANIETGKQRVLAHTLIQLASAVGVTLSDLLPPTAAGPSETIREELSRKLDLPDERIYRLVRKLAPVKARRQQ